MKKKIRLIIVSLVIVAVFLIAKTVLEPDASSQQVSQSLTDPSAVVDETDQSPIVEEQEPEIEKVKVVIDPGHGGEDPGAEGASGSYEKNFTLRVSQMIASLLEDDPYIQVYMTREEDVFLSSETRERPQYANELDADLFLSIHANTFADPTVTGTETFYYHDHSLSLAETIQRHVVEATGFRDRGVSQENFFVLRDTHMPAALVEVGYITNPLDEEVMLTEEFQRSVAESIVAGIREYTDPEPSVEGASNGDEQPNTSLQ